MKKSNVVVVERKTVRQKLIAIILAGSLPASMISVPAFATETPENNTMSIEAPANTNTASETNGTNENAGGENNNEGSGGNGSDTTGDVNSELGGEGSGDEGNGTDDGSGSEQDGGYSEGINEVETFSLEEGDGLEETENQEATTATFDAESGTLTVTGVEEINQTVLRELLNEISVSSSDVTKLEINDVKTISAAAFRSYWGSWNNLKTISLNNVDMVGVAAFGDSNHRIETISLNNIGTLGDEAFLQANALTSLTMTNVRNVGRSPFSYCNALTDLHLVCGSEGIGNLGVTMFYKCDGLRNVTISGDINTSFSTNTQGIFSQCKGPINLTFEDMDEVPAYVFSGNGAIQSVTFDNVSTVGANAFNGCSGITDVIFEGVTSIGSSAFSGCSQITTIDASGVSSIGDRAFFGCTGIEGLTLDGVKTIGERAFCGCTSIEELELNGLESISDYAFQSCTGLETISLSEIGTIGKYVLFEATGLQTINVSDMAKIGEYALSNVPSLNVTMEDACIVVNITNVDTIDKLAFYASTGIKSISMEGVGSIGDQAFRGCTNLKSIDSLSNVSGSIGGFAFYECPNLEGLTIADATKMGYVGSAADVMERVQAILSGKFKLDNAESIKELELEGWTAGAVGQSENWDRYDNGTQLMEQARWANESEGIAEVKVDAYYTGEKQMDYIFVADLSASMANLGNPGDNNARFYDMQSKLMDMTGKLLTTPGYDCQISIVTFGGKYVPSSNKPNEFSEHCQTLGFTKNAEDVENFIIELEPWYENTDYGLGLKAALDVVNQQKEGRNTVVVFLSDGNPTANGSGDKYGIEAAKQITDAGVDIYGVLHSPTSSSRDKALAAMNDVCLEVYESQNTEEFGKAMNAAFAAVYGNNTVTIPVNAADFDVSNLSATAGNVSYADGVITWTLEGMPFTQHSLTYSLTLKDELKSRVGTYTYNINNGAAHFGEAGSTDASVDLTMGLSRTVAPTIVPGPATGVVGQVITQVAAAAGIAAAVPAPAAPAVATITDDANPLAANPSDAPEIEEIADDEIPMSAFDEPVCTTHNLMYLGIFATLIYGVGVLMRRLGYKNQIERMEKSITGTAPDNTERAKHASEQVQGA